MQRIDIEFMALRAGLKPGIRIAADVTSAPAITERYQRGGCAVFSARGRVGLERRPRVLLYIAGSPQAAAGLRATEAHLLDPTIPPRDKAFFTREFGLRLGYPQCCVDAFAERSRRGGGRLREGDRDRHDPDFVHVHDAWVPRPDWRLNNLLMRHHLRLISFAVCRFDCARALVHAHALEDLVARDAPAALPVLQDRLRRPLLLAPDGARSWVHTQDAIITAAEPPRAPGGAPVPLDAARAPNFLGARVDHDGRLIDRGIPAPRLLQFLSLR